MLMPTANYLRVYCEPDTAIEMRAAGKITKVEKVYKGLPKY